MTRQCDAVVVGMGPGGEEVAGRLAEEGLDVVGVERSLVGGECPYWGCIPSKMMIRAANLLAEARRVPAMAGGAEVAPDWGSVAKRIRDEATDHWDDRVAVERFEKKGGRFVRGSGRLDGAGRVRVGEEVFEARRAVVLNPGTAPRIPPVPGLAVVDYWTNHEVVEADSLPESIVVMGGGAIGLEFSQVMARFGVAVTIIDVAPNLLAVEEPEAGAVLLEVLRREGAEVHLGVAAASVRQGGGGFEVDLDSGRTVSGERLLVATGRQTQLAGLGLETVGIDPQQQWIPVDEHMRAGEKLWAVGDATGKGAFTHISMYQARIALADILGQEHPPADYRALPRVTFTDPEVGAAGLTEAQARQRGLQVRAGLGDGRSSTRGWIHGPGNEGFIKLVEDAEQGVLVGGTAVGPMGGEVMAMLALAVQREVPVADMRNMIYAYPTFHRGVEDALAALRRRPP